MNKEEINTSVDKYYIWRTNIGYNYTHGIVRTYFNIDILTIN